MQLIVGGSSPSAASWHASAVSHSPWKLEAVGKCQGSPGRFVCFVFFFFMSVSLEV